MKRAVGELRPYRFWSQIGDVNILILMPDYSSNILYDTELLPGEPFY